MGISKIEHLFPGVILKDNSQTKNELMEEEEDSYEEDLKFYLQFVENKKKMKLENTATPVSLYALGNHPLFSATIAPSELRNNPVETIKVYQETTTVSYSNLKPLQV